MKVLILDLCYEKDSLHKQEFVYPVADILKRIGVDFDVRHFAEDFDVHFYEKVILCGVALKDFEYMNHVWRFEWIKEFRGDVLGICAGAQVIGKVFGCSLEDGEEIGFVAVQLIDDDKIFEGVELREVYCMHSSCIRINERFDEIARTKDYTQVFRLKEESRDVYGVLFHPEVRNKKLVENFILK